MSDIINAEQAATPAATTTDSTTAATTTTDGTQTKTKTPRKKNNIPRNLAKKIARAIFALQKMIDEKLELNYLSNADAATLFSDTENMLKNKTTTKSARSPVADQISTAMKAMFQTAGSIKLQLQMDFGKKQALLKYGSFAIEKSNRGYTLPSDPESMLSVIPIILDALNTFGYTKKDFGTAWWTSQSATLTDLLSKSKNVAGDFSGHTAAVRENADKINLFLNSVIHLVKAHYPNNVDAMLRAFGFLKERS